MAAAADRLVDDVLECVSPELVLVDATLSAEVRRHLAVPDDTLTRLGRRRIESRPATQPAEVAIAEDVEVEPEPLQVPQADLSLAEPERGIDDLIVVPAEEQAQSESTSGTYPLVPTLAAVADEALTRLGHLRIESAPAARPAEVAITEDVYLDPEPLRVSSADLGIAEHEFGAEDLIVIPAEDQAQGKGANRMYPVLPTRPPGDPYEEDATDVVLRQIREHFEVEIPKEPGHRALSIVSAAAALCSVVLLAVDVQLGLFELPRWLHV